MISSEINFIDELSYRQIQCELKKRRLSSTGKKIIIVKRLKVAYENEIIKNQLSNVTKFHDLPNEIYREIFDYLCSFDIMHSFHGLNHRLSEVIRDIPMKLNFNDLSQIEYKRVLKHVVPKIIDQSVSIEIGQSYKMNRCFSSLYSSESLIDSFIQSLDFNQFIPKELYLLAVVDKLFFLKNKMASSTSADPTVIAKEIKAQLKQAREVFNQKDYSAALKLCEAIVKKDKTCYTGWIMIAACAQELKQFHQAESALHKAIELDENQSVVYQGIVQLSERAPGFLNESDITSAFRKLCSLTRPTDPTKFFDHAKKYIEYLKKKIEVQPVTTNEQTNPYRIQLAELCKEIVEEKRLQLNQDDERHYRLLSTEILATMKTISTILNEFLSSNYFWLSQSSSDNILRLNYYEKYIQSICQMGRSSADIVDYCNECLALFPNSRIAQNTIIIINLETLLPQIYDSLAPIAKLTDALNRIRSDENSQISIPAICGKAYFSIRNGKYSTALESLLNLNEEDGYHLVIILKMVCYAHLHIIKETIDMVSIARTKLTNFIVKDVVSSIESLIDLCLALITYDQGLYEKSIQLFEKLHHVTNKFHNRAVYGQFNAYIKLNKPIEGRTCYDTIKDNLEPNQELSCRLQLAQLEEYPSELLKIVQAALKEANENEELFELTVQGWLSVGQAYLSIQRS
ncbi:unnamed protein product, partial [Rotaria socialis]